MHGICKEILKLVRASSALHRITDRSRRAEAAFFDQADRNDPEYDTESYYFELLQKIGHKIELRVIVGILAGASAGGINATMLARALSHDLPILRQRDLWLDNADVTVLLAPEARAGRWSKWILKPLIWGAAATGLFDAVRDNEVRRKLSLFLRSRWFKPPFYGLGMAGLMYDAAAAMGDPKTPTASLLPTGQGLDLFVTLTDYYGYQQLLPIHDPPFVYELEHRHVLHFLYRLPRCRPEASLHRRQSGIGGVQRPQQAAGFFLDAEGSAFRPALRSADRGRIGVGDQPQRPGKGNQIDHRRRPTPHQRTRW